MSKIIPLASAIKLMKNAGAYRVGADAAEKMVEIMEQFGDDLARKANKISLHSGRRTVKGRDIKLAYTN